MREQFGTPVDDFDTDSHGLQTAIDGQALPTETIEQNTQQNVEDAHVQRVAKVCLAIFFREYIFSYFLPLSCQFACDTSFGKVYKSYEVVEAVLHTTDRHAFQDYSFELLVDVYFHEDKSFDHVHACTVEKFVVIEHLGDLSLVTHEVSPLQCMGTPAHKRKHRDWVGHTQKYTK